MSDSERSNCHRVSFSLFSDMLNIQWQMMTTEGTFLKIPQIILETVKRNVMITGKAIITYINGKRMGDLWFSVLVDAMM